MGLCTWSIFSDRKSRRSAAGIHEHALTARLQDLQKALNNLGGQSSARYLENDATTQDLAEAVQVSAKSLNVLEQRLVARALPRLRDSLRIKEGIAGARAAHASFARCVTAYQDELRAWEAIRPDLVQARLLVPAPPAPAPAQASSQAGAEAPATLSDETITFKALEGPQSLDVSVAREVLCARSAYFWRLYKGPLGLSAQKQPAKLVVPDPALGREAILAVLRGQAPAFTPDNYLALHGLFDMWHCEDMLSQWHTGVGDYLRAVGVDSAMEQAAAQSPGSSLSESLFLGAWNHALPVTAQHFLQAHPHTHENSSHRFRSSVLWGDLWSCSSDSDDATQLDVRWRYLQAPQAMRSERFISHGLELSLALTEDANHGLDAYRVQLRVHRGPKQPTGILRLSAIGPQGFVAIQKIHIAGEINGLSIDKHRELRRSRGAPGNLSEEISAGFDLCTLGGHGVMAGQNKPLFSQTHMDLHLRATVTGLFAAPHDAG